MSIVLALAIGTLVAGGVWLVLDRDLLRAVLGVGLLGHGAVLLLLANGPAGAPPIVGTEGPFADPLPQALALTAIVIGFGVSAYLLAIARVAPSDETGTVLPTATIHLDEDAVAGSPNPDTATDEQLQEQR